MTTSPQSKLEDPDDRPSTGKPRKNRKRWCKGRAGTEHDYTAWVTTTQILSFTVRERICKNCGRKDRRVDQAKEGPK